MVERLTCYNSYHNFLFVAKDQLANKALIKNNGI